MARGKKKKIPKNARTEKLEALTGGGKKGGASIKKRQET